jgi:hypothetical protein
LNYPSVDCTVFVHGSLDSAQRFDSLFVIDLQPKGLEFPEIDDVVFKIGQCASSVEELRQYLSDGFDYFVTGQNWLWLTEEQVIQQLPAPFNAIDATIELRWSSGDVQYDGAAKLICSLHDKAFTEAELQRLPVGQLQVIAAVKGAKESGSRKQELIDGILSNQKSKGLRAVRVKQQRMEVFS